MTIQVAILAAGMGTRLGRPWPKPLTKLDDGRSIMGQQRDNIYCTPCHGASGRGDGPAGTSLNPRPGDFTQHMVTGKHTDGQVFLWIKNGFPNSAGGMWSSGSLVTMRWSWTRKNETFSVRLGFTHSVTPLAPRQWPTISPSMWFRVCWATPA